MESFVVDEPWLSRATVSQTNVSSDIIEFYFLEKPSFDLSSLFGPLGKKEIRVKAGEPLTIDIPINGSPTPIITWTKDGESVQPTREFVSFVFFRI